MWSLARYRATRAAGLNPVGKMETAAWAVVVARHLRCGVLIVIESGHCDGNGLMIVGSSASIYASFFVGNSSTYLSPCWMCAWMLLERDLMYTRCVWPSADNPTTSALRPNNGKSPSRFEGRGTRRYDFLATVSPHRLLAGVVSCASRGRAGPLRTTIYAT